jgi:hypothetical protein
MKTGLPTGRPIASALFRFYGSRSVEELALVETALVCLYSERAGEPLPEVDLSGLREVWHRVAVSPVFFDTLSGEILTTLPGSEDAFPDLRFLVLDEPTQARSIFGGKVAAILAR